MAWMHKTRRFLTACLWLREGHISLDALLDEIRRGLYEAVLGLFVDTLHNNIPEVRLLLKDAGGGGNLSTHYLQKRWLFTFNQIFFCK